MSARAMRPPVALLSAVRPCLASTSHRPLVPRYLPPHPHLTRSAGSWTQWIQSRISIRQNANRQREELEQQRARQRAAEQGEGSIFDTDAPKKGEVDVEDGEKVETLEPSDGAGAVGEAKRLAKKEGARIVGARSKKKVTEQTGRTAFFKMSPRKLNKLANQVGGQPIDAAILQMQFSVKRASRRIKSMLAQARDQAIDRGLRRERLVVAEAWVNKGNKVKRIEIKGRGRHGIRETQMARMHVVLKEGKTRREKKEEEFRKRLGLIRSAGRWREDVPIRNARPMYVW